MTDVRTPDQGTTASEGSKPPSTTSKSSHYTSWTFVSEEEPVEPLESEIAPSPLPDDMVEIFSTSPTISK